MKSEAEVQALVRLEAARKGIFLTRNNVGAGKLENGSFIRWGLCNESKQVNEKIKSADLVGCKSIKITADMVGSIIAMAVVRECKKEGWVYTGTGEEPAQLEFLKLISRLGGDAQFCTGEGTL